MTSPLPSRSGQRGFSLLEAMIALSVLLIGLVGMFQLQIWGMTATQGARAQTQAAEVARQLAAALERVQYDDPLLTANVTGVTPPPEFGKVVQPDGSLDASDFRAWNDADAASLPNVRLDTDFDRDAVDPALPAFQRRWSVWAPSGLAAQYTRVIAVSVVYREKTFQRAQEVVLLTQVSNIGATVSNAAAYR
jgi:prepilin-type N-terminal cleavage/methylation domain-containing protein